MICHNKWKGKIYYDRCRGPIIKDERGDKIEIMLKVYYDRLWETCHNIFPNFFLSSFLFLISILSLEVSFLSQIVTLPSCFALLLSLCSSLRSSRYSSHRLSRCLPTIHAPFTRRSWLSHLWLCLPWIGFLSFLHLVCTCVLGYGSALEWVRDVLPWISLLDCKN